MATSFHTYTRGITSSFISCSADPRCCFLQQCFFISTLSCPYATFIFSVRQYVSSLSLSNRCNLINDRAWLWLAFFNISFFPFGSNVPGALGRKRTQPVYHYYYIGCFLRQFFDFLCILFSLSRTLSLQTLCRYIFITTPLLCSKWLPTCRPGTIVFSLHFWPEPFCISSLSVTENLSRVSYLLLFFSRH